MNKINIWFGSGENAILSNIADREFSFRGRKYYSVEHAYQTLKSGMIDEITYGRYSSGGKKYIGLQRVNRDISISLMEDLILESFKQCDTAKMALLDTGSAELTHWQDNGIWKTEFPRILMEVRDYFQKGKSI